jgi:hypothetical protein
MQYQGVPIDRFEKVPAMVLKIEDKLDQEEDAKELGPLFFCGEAIAHPCGEKKWEPAGS